MGLLDIVKKIRAEVGPAYTAGLSEEKIVSFLEFDTNLQDALKMASEAFACLPATEREMIKKPEREVLKELQEGIENFYPEDSLSPFVPLAAKGPWIISAYGAIIYDVGGYGMMGFGHNPDKVLKVLSKPQVMANVMTPSFAQKRFIESLQREIGHTRSADHRHPYHKYICLNSGSEAVCLAARIGDVNTKNIAEATSEPFLTKILVIDGAFHGRTMRAAMASHSSHSIYQKHLYSFKDINDCVLTVEQNNIEALTEIFARAKKEKFHIEALFMEPVMGEGDPGRALTREFYDVARRLTTEHNSILIIDSIQAGLRATGELSLMDYPGFQNAIPPEIETYSKALNAGNFPLSLIALNAKAAKLYHKGIYGNTMTANPRALEVAITVLDNLTPEIRTNIKKQGKKLTDEFLRLGARSDNMIQNVVGTGLLLSVRLNTSCCSVSGELSSEEFVRRHGINVVHGGRNSLRLTPYFLITDKEIELITSVFEEALHESCNATATCCRRGVPQPEYVQYR